MGVKFLKDLVQLNIQSYANEPVKLPKGFQLETTIQHLTEEVLVCSSETRICVVIRGSNMTARDWGRNLSIRCRAGEDVGYVHRGFYSAARKVINETLLIETLQLLLKQKRRDIILSGHSSGGAVVNFIGFFLEYYYDIRPTAVYTFGSPRAIDAAYYRFMKSVAYLPRYTYNIIHPLDIVPQVFPFFVPFGTLINVENLVRIHPKKSVLNLLRLLDAVFNLNLLKYHRLETYLASLKAHKPSP